MLGRHRVLKALALTTLFACGQSIADEDVDSSEGALLPNGTVFETSHDGGTYRLIAEYFAKRDLDMHVSQDGLDAFDPAWPLDDPKTAVLNRVGTPVIFAQFGFYHTGLDVLRSDATVGLDVLAPHDGIAVMFDWAGNKITTVTNPYTTVVGIYDRASHIVTVMMHVKPTTAIAQAGDPFEVHKGDVIGQLASAPLPAADAPRLSNAQIIFVDGEKMKILDPGALFKTYHDAVKPEVRSLYIAGDDRVPRSEFRSGRVDVLVEAFDRDDDSNRNLEVSGIAFTIKDQKGKVLKTLERCDLGNLYESISKEQTDQPFNARDLIDFGTAQPQVSGAWPNSDVDNPQRTFRYALTNLATDGRKCSVKGDADGFLTVADEVTTLNVVVTLWDPKGNQSETTIDIPRAKEAAPDGGAGAPPGDPSGGFFR